MSNQTFAMRLLVEPLRSTAAASVGASYTEVGNPFANPIRILYIQNLTDETVMFSLDGVNDAFPLRTDAFLLLDISTNKSTFSGLYLPIGSKIFVKQLGVPTTGAVYVTAFYATEGSHR